jgi:hypothetical protein
MRRLLAKNVTLESFIDNVKSDILRTAKVNTDTFDNLTPGERTVLQSLRSNEDIIIKPADKGSSVVVMEKSAAVSGIFDKRWKSFNMLTKVEIHKS